MKCKWIAAQASRLYARGTLTGNRPGTTPRVHARADQHKAICGAEPASHASHWMPAADEITCPKCISALRWHATLKRPAIF